jgi:hypothetical protein
VKENGGTSVFSQHFRRTLPVCGAFPAIPKSRPFSLGFLAVVPAGHMKIGIWGMGKTSTSKSFLWLLLLLLKLLIIIDYYYCYYCYLLLL